ETSRSLRRKVRPPWPRKSNLFGYFVRQTSKAACAASRSCSRASTSRRLPLSEKFSTLYPKSSIQWTFDNMGASLLLVSESRPPAAQRCISIRSTARGGGTKIRQHGLKLPRAPPRQHHDERFRSSGVGAVFSDCPHDGCRCRAVVDFAMASAS